MIGGNKLLGGSIFFRIFRFLVMVFLGGRKLCGGVKVWSFRGGFFFFILSCVDLEILYVYVDVKCVFCFVI